MALLLSTVLPSTYGAAWAASDLVSTRYAPTELNFAIALLGIMVTAMVAIQYPKERIGQLPGSALLVLLSIHIFFGWLLGVYNAVWWVWVGVISGCGAIAKVRSVELGMMGLRSFILAGVVAIAMLVASLGFFANMPLFQPLVRSLALGLAIAAAWFWAVGGARFRMESMGVEPWGQSATPKEMQIVRTIVGVSWEGLWLGWLLDTFFIPQWGELINQMLAR
ncbi:hypothetical protein [Myxacorys almedinensis]|nr:hypothetical protein [Myxacorys almedinensis]